MPIVKAKPTTEAVVKPNIPKIASPELRSNVVDTKYEPLSSLITYTSGSQWKVTYYSQVVDKDNDLRGQDPGQSAVYQQYRRIELLEIKVENALSGSQNTETNMQTYQGTAHVHSFLIPNKGDMFAADVGDGREGVFQVTLSEKKSLLKGSVYYIEYVLVYFSDTSPERRLDLDTKTVQKLHYLRDFMLHGQNPLVTTDEYDAIEKLKVRYFEIVRYYFDCFFSKEYSTLLVPGQPQSLYDPYVTAFMVSVMDTRDHENIRYTRILNLDDDNALKQPQLFAALRNKNLGLLLFGNKEMGILSAKAFQRSPVLEGIRYSGIANVVYPVKPFKTQDNDNNNLEVGKLPLTDALVSVPTAGGSLTDLIYADEIEFDQSPVRLIKSVLSDPLYVLSENFYSDTPGQTVLEVMTRRYLESEAVDPVSVLELTRGYQAWGGLERFYYLPIVLTLIKAATRSY